jgi:hypothetical protein
VTVKLTQGNVIAVILVNCMFYAGGTTLRTGEFYISPSGGGTINLEGPAAYIMGASFIGLGLFVAYRVFRG